MLVKVDSLDQRRRRRRTHHGGAAEGENVWRRTHEGEAAEGERRRGRGMMTGVPPGLRRPGWARFRAENPEELGLGHANLYSKIQEVEPSSRGCRRRGWPRYDTKAAVKAVLAETKNSSSTET